MKQTTKVLLPLGLFMSIVIPVTVKALFTDADFFQSDESSKIDYLQPYKFKPEHSLDMPNTGVTSAEEPEAPRDEEKRDVNNSTEDKISTTHEVPAHIEAQLQLELQNEARASSAASQDADF